MKLKPTSIVKKRGPMTVKNNANGSRNIRRCDTMCNIHEVILVRDVISKKVLPHHDCETLYIGQRMHKKSNKNGCAQSQLLWFYFKA